MSTRECLTIAREALDAAMQYVSNQLRAAKEPEQVVSLSFELRAIIRERAEIECELHRIAASRNDG